VRHFASGTFCIKYDRRDRRVPFRICHFPPVSRQFKLEYPSDRYRMLSHAMFKCQKISDNFRLVFQKYRTVYLCRRPQLCLNYTLT